MSRASMLAVDLEYGRDEDEVDILQLRRFRQPVKQTKAPRRVTGKPWWDVKLSALSNEELNDLYALACNRRYMPRPYSNHAVETLRAIEKVKRSRVGHAYMSACRPLCAVRRSRSCADDAGAKVLPFKQRSA
ncbi:MAG: hypothetical protein WC641_01880 [Patescibacteria group bacterium]